MTYRIVITTSQDAQPQVTGTAGELPGDTTWEITADIGGDATIDISKAPGPGDGTRYLRD